MENIIPTNGRIAIVDDKIEQALPLMKVLSKNNLPFTYYNGNDSDSLPDIPENDIRILFLDLNLLGEQNQEIKSIQSSLIGVLKRIISPDNYPYILVLWSRQESEYKNVIENIFNNTLKNCAPISIKTFIKSDYFPNFSEEIDSSKDINKILKELLGILNDFPAYSHLLQWENQVHNSADSTINDIFKDYHSHENWNENANCILDMFARSYLEKQYANSDEKAKVKASMLFFNDVLIDTLEQSVEKTDIINDGKLECNIEESKKSEIRANINSRLLLSRLCDSNKQPGSVICAKNEQIFTDLINNSLKQLPKTIEKKDIFDSMTACKVVVTPACDYAQNKAKYDRIILGGILKEEYKRYIDNTSEAIYTSPTFYHKSNRCFIVLNFRFFITEKLIDDKSQAIFRLRNSMLAEIQSKLSRHISRQGIMNL